MSRIKFAFQRMFRGYDDTAKWALNDYIADIAIPMLKHLVKNGVGNPVSTTDKQWKADLRKMIKGFEAYKKIQYSANPNFSKLDKIQTEGLRLFAENFSSLWD